MRADMKEVAEPLEWNEIRALTRGHWIWFEESSVPYCVMTFPFLLPSWDIPGEKPALRIGLQREGKGPVVHRNIIEGEVVLKVKR